MTVDQGILFEKPVFPVSHGACVIGIIGDLEFTQAVVDTANNKPRLSGDTLHGIV